MVVTSNSNIQSNKHQGSMKERKYIQVQLVQFTNIWSYTGQQHYKEHHMEEEDMRRTTKKMPESKQ